MNTAVFDPRECGHHSTRLVADPDVNGNLRYRHQCQTCGEGVGNWIARAIIEREFDRAAIPMFDTALHKRMKKAAADISAHKWQERRNRYAEYLQSDAWAERRALVLERDNDVCQGCLQAVATQVHHLTYDNIGNELLFELVALCGSCHEIAHGKDQG